MFVLIQNYRIYGQVIAFNRLSTKNEIHSITSPKFLTHSQKMQRNIKTVQAFNSSFKQNLKDIKIRKSIDKNLPFYYPRFVETATKKKSRTHLRFALHFTFMCRFRMYTFQVLPAFGL